MEYVPRTFRRLNSQRYISDRAPRVDDNDVGWVAGKRAKGEPNVVMRSCSVKVPILPIVVRAERRDRAFAQPRSLDEYLERLDAFFSEPSVVQFAAFLRAVVKESELPLDRLFFTYNRPMSFVPEPPAATSDAEEPYVYVPAPVNQVSYHFLTGTSTVEDDPETIMTGYSNIYSKYFIFNGSRSTAKEATARRSYRLRVNAIDEYICGLVLYRHHCPEESLKKKKRDHGSAFSAPVDKEDSHKRQKSL